MSHEPSFKRLQDAILACRDSLTPTERTISNHLLEQPRSVALMSIQELATRLKTGPASIIRVSHKLGYKGYSELKQDLKQEMREDDSPLARFKLALDRREDLDFSGIHAVARQEMDNIQSTLALMDADCLASAVTLLAHASLVFTAGVGISSHLAGLAAFVFQRIGLRAFPVLHTGLGMAEQLIAIRKGDVFLAFSFPPYSPQTIETASTVRARGASVLGITNQTLGPLAEHCEVLLVAKTDSCSPSNSLSAPLLLIHALATAVASCQRQRSSKALERTMTLRNKRL